MKDNRVGLESNEVPWALRDKSYSGMLGRGIAAGMDSYRIGAAAGNFVLDERYIFGHCASAGNDETCKKG